MLTTGTLTECGGKETENNFSAIFGQYSSDKLKKYLINPVSSQPSMKCNRVISLLDFRRRKATRSFIGIAWRLERISRASPCTKHIRSVSTRGGAVQYCICCVSTKGSAVHNQLINIGSRWVLPCLAG